MIPIIKRADKYLYDLFGIKYLVGKDNAYDMCDSLGMAFCYWLWWCGVPARIAFKFFRSKNHDKHQ